MSNKIEFEANARRETLFIAEPTSGIYGATVIVLPESVAEGKYRVTLALVEPEPELKPCPFCGGEAHVEISKSFYRKVRCDNCGAGTQKWIDTEFAVEAWDRRVE